MDPMSQAVDEMRLRRASYRRVRGASAREISHGAGECGVMLVLGGRAQLRAASDAYALAAGDLIVLPSGAPHTLALNRDSELLCARLEFDAPDHPLFGVLPTVIHAPPDRLARSPRCVTLVEYLISEARGERDGSAALATRLTEVLFVEVMRFFAPPPGVECPIGGWFAGLGDPVLRRVLVAIHDQPERDWSVATLAKLARESRSAFAAHFTRILREPPMAYVARWRMFCARSFLRQTELPLDAIAERVGYGSAAALSLAFQRAHGVSPGAFRKQSRRVA